MKRLYVKCPKCSFIFPSGFRAESATQVIGFFYLCPKCRRIVPCAPPEYLEKVNEEFKKMMRVEEIFALPIGNRLEIMGPDLFPFSSEILVKRGVFLTSDKGIVRYEEGCN